MADRLDRIKAGKDLLARHQQKKNSRKSLGSSSQDPRTSGADDSSDSHELLAHSLLSDGVKNDSTTTLTNTDEDTPQAPIPAIDVSLRARSSISDMKPPVGLYHDILDDYGKATPPQVKKQVLQTTQAFSKETVVKHHAESSRTRVQATAAVLSTPESDTKSADFERLERKCQDLTETLKQEEELREQMSQNTASLQQLLEDNQSSLESERNITDKIKTNASHLKSSISQKEYQISQLRTQLESMARKITSQENSNTKQNAHISDLEHETAQLESQVQSLSESLKAAEGKIQQLLAQQSSVRVEWEIQQKDWSDHMKQLTQKFHKSDDVISHLRDENTILKQQLHDSIQNANNVESVKETRTVNNQVETSDNVMARLKELEQIASELRLEKSILQDKVTAKSSSTDQDTSLKFKQLQREYNALQSSMEANFQELEIMRSRVRELEQRAPDGTIDYKEKYVESCIKITSLVKDRRNLLAEVNVLSSRLKNMEDVVRYGSSSRQVDESDVQVQKLNSRVHSLTKIITQLTKMNWAQGKEIASLQK